MEIIIGSRGSKLALWQSEWVKARLEALDAGVSVRIEIVKTSGDIMRDVPLSIIGGQGAFTKELEVALLERRINVAVHSLKDLPTIVPAGLSITATPEREDPRDALVLRADTDTRGASIKGLAEGAIVGTSSLRRIAQLKHLRPDLRIKDLRGNVDTRLRKLDEGEYDALILASAGLRRLGFGARIGAAINAAEMLPAVGQGALGIETRADDIETNALVMQLDDMRTRAAVLAERALLRSLGGGCQVPIAAHAIVEGDRMRLDGLVASLDGAHVIRDTLEGSSSDAAGLGDALAARLLERGAGTLLAELPVQMNDE
ncbi:MAG: hydroxymethylbilane synthase [Acidobacteriota bacterium]|jgi:hydroxymethylbilane synthase|nr:hydroxymethylbilane synthase [Acidobacteriota bacterium]MDT7808144.1 hydroxymethylbilane synthase [Acidobacteriota bacterium]